MARAEPLVVEVRDIQPGEYPTAVSLLAEGFRDNPLPTVMLGPHADRRVRGLERLFGAMFRVMDSQTPLVATDGSSIVGVTGIAPPGTCQPTVTQLSKMLPSLVSCGPSPLLRLGSWMHTWGSLDPSEPHAHLGPFAVDSRLRGRGIGSQILAEYCRRLDASGLMGYLETETEDNVRLYTRFGFTVTARRQVIGVPNWFMRREPVALDAG